jgi:flagellar biosynthesis/type III secretory pathway chaperone
MGDLTGGDFARRVADEIQTVRQFIALLEEESRALQKGDVAALESITESKERLADVLARMGDARQKCMDALGFAHEASGVAEWLARQEGEAGENLRVAWQTLMDLARAARELNLTNGKCIALLSRDTRARLEALTSAAPGTDCYQPGKGQTLSTFSRVNAGVRIRDCV